jgi:hypothetical protein
VALNSEVRVLCDTDMVHHERSAIPALSSAARAKVASAGRNLSTFSLVEIKGSLIQDMIFVRAKIADSASYTEVVERIQKLPLPASRKMKRSFVSLSRAVERLDIPVKSWKEAQGVLLSLIEGEIVSLWEELTKGAWTLSDDLKCSRAQEGVVTTDSSLEATVPHCRRENTKCIVTDFAKSHGSALETLLVAFDQIPEAERTKELSTIAAVARTSIDQGFPWQGTTCRKVGDLLIGLSAVGHGSLLTSNGKEHQVLHGPLGYGLDLFQITASSKPEELAPT